MPAESFTLRLDPETATNLKLLTRVTSRKKNDLIRFLVNRSAAQIRAVKDSDASDIFIPVSAAIPVLEGARGART